MHPCGAALLVNSHHVLFHWIMYSNIWNIYGTNLSVDFYPLLFYVLISMFILCCDLHSFHSAYHCDMYQVSQYLFYNGHIVLNYITHFMYSPLNPYVYIHWMLEFKYIIIIIITCQTRWLNVR